MTLVQFLYISSIVYSAIAFILLVIVVLGRITYDRKRIDNIYYTRLYLYMSIFWLPVFIFVMIY